MEDKQDPWWRRALRFALGGIRSALGLFARSQGGEARPEPPCSIGEGRKIEVEIYTEEDPEEEIELTENSPKTEAAIANPEAEVRVAETSAEVEAPAIKAREEEPETASNAEAPNADKPEIGKAPGEALPVESSSATEYVMDIEAPLEVGAGQPPCANEAVDEAGLLAESAITGAAAPVFPEPHMELNQSERYDRAEEMLPQTNPEEAAESAQADLAQQGENSSTEAANAANAVETTAAKAIGAAGTPDIAPPPTVGEASAPGQKVAAPGQPHAKHFIKLEGREKEADSSPFSVIVSQVYDGPLDLLLDLIRKQDIDIYDIPIARITAQFLAYVNQLKATDVDVAGEFIYTASLLIHIKSKMLLPRAPAGPDEQAEDPRRELVERLLEHERFKNAAQMLQQKQMLEAATWTNPGIREFREDVEAEPEIAADTVDLVRVFRDILERVRNRPVLNLEEDSVTVSQMIQFLGRRLNMEDKPVALRRLLSHTKSERALIAMFLALLELVRLQAILLRQDRAFSEIFIKKSIEFDSVVTEGMANAQDDWR